MSDTDQKKSEIVVLHRMPSHHALMKSNRWLFRCVLFLMAVIFIGGFFLMPVDDYQTLKKPAATSYGEKTTPICLRKWIL